MLERPYKWRKQNDETLTDNQIATKHVLVGRGDRNVARTLVTRPARPALVDQLSDDALGIRDGRIRTRWVAPGRDERLQRRDRRR